jgi:hypothetical protein
MSSSRWIVAGLIALNVALGAAVYERLHVDQTAQAQIGGRREVITVAGFYNGASVLYLYDTIGGQMVVLRPDSVNKKVDVLAQRDVGADFSRMK